MVNELQIFTWIFGTDCNPSAVQTHMHPISPRKILSNPFSLYLTSASLRPTLWDRLLWQVQIITHLHCYTVNWYFTNKTTDAPSLEKSNMLNFENCHVVLCWPKFEFSPHSRSNINCDITVVEVVSIGLGYDANLKWHMPIWGKICQSKQNYILFLRPSRWRRHRARLPEKSKAHKHIQFDAMLPSGHFFRKTRSVMVPRFGFFQDSPIRPK